MSDLFYWNGSRSPLSERKWRMFLPGVLFIPCACRSRPHPGGPALCPFYPGLGPRPAASHLFDCASWYFALSSFASAGPGLRPASVDLGVPLVQLRLQFFRRRRHDRSSFSLHFPCRANLTHFGRKLNCGWTYAEGSTSRPTRRRHGRRGEGRRVGRHRAHVRCWHRALKTAWARPAHRCGPSGGGWANSIRARHPYQEAGASLEASALSGPGARHRRRA